MLLLRVVIRALTLTLLVILKQLHAASIFLLLDGSSANHFLVWFLTICWHHERPSHLEWKIFKVARNVNRLLGGLIKVHWAHSVAQGRLEWTHINEPSRAKILKGIWDLLKGGSGRLFLCLDGETHAHNSAAELHLFA